MTIRVSGKRISVSDALRGRVSDRTEEVLRKYFDGGYSGHCTFSKDGFGFRADCALHLASGATLEASANAADAYASADLALMQIEKRLRRYKSRLKDRSARMEHAAERVKAQLGGGDVGVLSDEATLDAQSYIIEAPEAESEEEVIAFNPVVIAETTTALKRLSVSEAVMELDFTGAPVVIFQHGSSGRVNMIYRRPDGNIGWVDPPKVNPKEHG
ncbi:MAG TPA: ribosome-associated translation inhibitor RaiA [Xanthobacteraceae bacterium]|nr:ribosome-associated translation inhibitor RaiA [Xanthobacteraceae bacterium]